MTAFAFEKKVISRTYDGGRLLCEGAVGALLESMLMGQRGISPGGILMNAIVGYLCGTVFAKIKNEENKKFWWKASLTILLSILLGVSLKTILDCLLYSLPLAIKIPTGLVAWLTDSLVMILFGLPLSLTLKKTVSRILGQLVLLSWHRALELTQVYL